jgi:hypothetical protein
MKGNKGLADNVVWQREQQQWKEICTAYWSTVSPVRSLRLYISCRTCCVADTTYGGVSGLFFLSCTIICAICVKKTFSRQHSSLITFWLRYPEVLWIKRPDLKWLGIFLFTTASRPALVSSQPPIQWVPGALSLRVKRQGREADHSPASRAEAKNAWSYTCTPPIHLHGVVLG